MNIDFSTSIDQYLDYFRQFFETIANFFAKLGIKLFADNEDTTAPEEEVTGA